jgi:hypothetical protein
MHQALDQASPIKTVSDALLQVISVGLLTDDVFEITHLPSPSDQLVYVIKFPGQRVK